MEYRLGVGEEPTTIQGGTGVLLLHPSTAVTDRVDTEFLVDDTDQFLVISTRTTAREVWQKLEFYDVDEDRASIIDAISVERGYSRRQSEDVTYLSSPSDIGGLLTHVESFLTSNEGKRRISLDSVTELGYYAGEQQALEAVSSLLGLLEEHDAVGLFHLATGVHDEGLVDEYRRLFDVIIELDDDGEIEVHLGD